MSRNDDYAVLVVDNGSGITKAGFGGEDAPRSIFSSVIGRLHHRAIDGTSLGHEDLFIGNAALEQRGILALKHPIDRGIVTNWDDMEKVYT